MAEWAETTLGELCALSGGGIQTGPFGSQLHASDYVQDGIPVVMPTNIGDNMIDPTGIARIRPADAARLGRYLLRPGDIVYSRRGDVEKRSLVRAQQAGWLCGTGCLRVGFGDASTTDPAFVSYLLGTEESRTWILRHAVGATMPNLNTSILASVPLRVPEYSVQRAIAEVLGALDDKISSVARLVQLSSELTTARFLRVVAHDSTHVAIGAAAELVVRGITPDYGDTEGSSIVLNQKCVRDGRVSLGPARRSLGTRVREEKLLRRHDVLVNSTGQGTLGRVARWTGKLQATVDSHITIVRPDPAVVDPACFGVALLGMESLIEGLSRGSTGQTELSRNDLMALTVALPALKAQRELGEAIESTTRLQDSLLAESTTLAAVRDTLLPQLMSGKLRVRDAEKTVEEVL